MGLGFSYIRHFLFQKTFKINFCPLHEKGRESLHVQSPSNFLIQETDMGQRQRHKPHFYHGRKMNFQCQPSEQPQVPEGGSPWDPPPHLAISGWILSQLMQSVLHTGESPRHLGMNTSFRSRQHHGSTQQSEPHHSAGSTPVRLQAVTCPSWYSPPPPPALPPPEGGIYKCPYHE